LPVAGIVKVIDSYAATLRYFLGTGVVLSWNRSQGFATEC
jgi:hypothetical protein